MSPTHSSVKLLGSALTALIALRGVAAHGCQTGAMADGVWYDGSDCK
jgi:hypothetical protein